MSEALFNEEFLKRIELLFLVSKKVFSGSSQAMRRSKKLGSGIDIADFRQYVAGDDLRHVDWNYYATTRELLVRLFEEEEDLRIYFLLDTSASMRIGVGEKLNYAKRIVGALSYIGLSNLDRVSVVPFGDDIVGTLPASRGRSQIWKVFRFLSRDAVSDKTDLAASLRKFVAQSRRRGLVVLVSDFYDKRGFSEAIDMLRHHRHEPLIIQVYDNNDLNPDIQGDLDLTDCETGEVVPVTVTPALLQRYREAHLAMLEELASYCRRKNVLYFGAPVQLPFDELVLQVFRAGGFIR